MSSPVISGFERKEVTYEINSAITEGDIVIVASDRKVVRPSSTTHFCGVCASIRDNYGSIVMRGPVTVRYTGTAPSIGYNSLTSAGDGSIMIDKSYGRLILVTDVDTDSGTCEILL